MEQAFAVAVLSDPGSVEVSARFQERVSDWLVGCFGPGVASDRAERTHRFLEEALELAQAAGCGRDDAIALLNYVFSRPPGEIVEETGGVMVTLAGFAEAHGVDMATAGEVELSRNRRRTSEIRAKRNRKPDNSPLPE